MFDKFLNYHVADNGTRGFDVPCVRFGDVDGTIQNTEVSGTIRERVMRDGLA